MGPLAAILAAGALAVPPPPVLDQAVEQARERYEYAVAQGARTLPSPDGRTFFVLWLPKGATTVIVTLHGSSSYAYDEFFLWHPYAKRRGHGILAVQWWLGSGPDDYLTPKQVYALVAPILKRHGFKKGRVLFHGFSRGSANTYAVTFLDRSSGNRFFGMTIANSGSWEDDYPPNRAIAQKGAAALAGTRWFLWCSRLDPQPKTGCPAMRRTREKIRRHGGEVLQLLEDPSGDHGGFHRNGANIERALDVFASVVR